MTNVLSDDASRCTAQVCEFGLHSDLYVGRPAAAKTGTTNAFTDNWTVGYTPQIVTGVWVGNADNTPMIGTTGITGAAPIWHDFMLKAFDILKLPPANFVQPSGVSFGYSCRLPGAYGTYSTFGSDIYVNENSAVFRSSGCGNWRDDLPAAGSCATNHCSGSGRSFNRQSHRPPHHLPWFNQRLLLPSRLRLRLRSCSRPLLPRPRNSLPPLFSPRPEPA